VDYKLKVAAVPVSNWRPSGAAQYVVGAKVRAAQRVVGAQVTAAQRVPSRDPVCPHRGVEHHIPGGQLADMIRSGASCSGQCPQRIHRVYRLSCSEVR
jgi:hypothetical protein